jgi:hypothetical protein
MKNLKLLSFWLLFGMLILAWCENTNNEWQYACESDDVCPIEWLTNNQENDEDRIIEENTNEEVANEESWEEVVGNTTSDQPMMRKMMVNEDATPEDIEVEMTETCANIWWTWSEWSCILEDGTTVMF